ncbi:hypothetical protein D9M70_515150 [compost metagenome]
MRIFHALEIGEHVRIGPAACAELVPAVVVFRMAAHIDETVDRGGAADHLAARRGDAPVVKIRFRFGEIAPVVALHAHRPGKGRRHLDEGADIRAAIFQHQHRVLAVFGQAVGERRTGGAGADDDIICLHKRGLSLASLVPPVRFTPHSCACHRNPAKRRLSLEDSCAPQTWRCWIPGTRFARPRMREVEPPLDRGAPILNTAPVPAPCRHRRSSIRCSG